MCLDGYLLTRNSSLGVQYLGEMRVFKVAAIKTLSTTPELRELELDLSKLKLNGSSMFEDSESITNGQPSLNVEVYKITGKSKFRIVTAKNSGGGGRSAGIQGPSFLEVGGLRKQIQLLKELVLHPLQSLKENTGKFKKLNLLAMPDMTVAW